MTVTLASPEAEMNLLTTALQLCPTVSLVVAAGKHELVSMSGKGKSVTSTRVNPMAFCDPACAFLLNRT